jgi:hypothetical protein
VSELPPLPPGFTLDGQQAAPAADGGLPPLPPGFSLDEAQPAAQDNRSFLGKVGDGVTNFAKGLANLRTSDIVKGVAHSVQSGATLPGQVYKGEVDPNSQEALVRSLDLAGMISPMSAGAKAGAVAEKVVPQVAQDASEMGIGLTAGQRLNNPALLSREDAIFGGAMGPKAQEVAQAARARQATEVLGARDTLGDAFGGGKVDLQRPADAGALVTEALQDAATRSKQGYQAKYAEATAGNGIVKAEAFPGMSSRIKDSLANRDQPVIIDDVLTPAANRALGELDKIQDLKLGTNGQPGAGDTVVGVDLRGVEQARKRLGAYARAAQRGSEDYRATRAIIGEFDGQIQKAVENGLFEGDEAFLGMWKDARKAFFDHQNTFKPRGAGDDVGRAMQAIVERDATPEQVANYLYGASKVGERPLSVRLASRLKNTLGEDSEHWAGIRQGAWQKITGVAEGKTEMGPQKMAERIFEFTNGNGQSLARQLFSPEEITQMNRFANIQKAMATKSGTANFSQSGNRLAALAREGFASISAALGASAGGPQGAAAGYAAGQAIKTMSGAMAAREARSLFSGEVPVSIGSRVGDATMGAGRALALPATLGTANEITVDRYRR